MMKEKRMRAKILGVLTAVLVLISNAGCAGQQERGDTSSTPREAQKGVTADIYKDEPSGTLNIVNQMGVPLILFAGSISNANMIGGIHANDERNFDFYNQIPRGSEHGSFLLRAVRESDYTTFGSNLKDEHIRYAALVTYDRKDMRGIRRIIQQDLGGEAQIIVNNDSDLVLELRLNNRDGQAITTLGPWERDKVVYLDPSSRGYTFFPVWQFYDRASASVRSVQPAGLDDTYQMRPVVPGGGRTVPRLPFATNANLLTTPFAAITVINDTYNGINFQRGTSPLTCKNGYEMINPGSETFEINIGDRPFEDIGGFTIDIGRGVSQYKHIPESRYEPGYNYIIRLRSDGTLTEMQRVSKMDITGDIHIILTNEN